MSGAATPTEALRMGGSDIRDKIIETLEANGDLKTSEFRRLVLFALVDLSRGAEDAHVCREEIKKANERIDQLEQNNIVLLAKKHPKWSMIIGGFAMLFVASVIGHLELWVWIVEIIESILEVPLP